MVSALEQKNGVLDSIDLHNNDASGISIRFLLRHRTHQHRFSLPLLLGLPTSNHTILHSFQAPCTLDKYGNDDSSRSNRSTSRVLSGLGCPAEPDFARIRSLVRPPVYDDRSCCRCCANQAAS